jgi:hypothetical protein
MIGKAQVPSLLRQRILNGEALYRVVDANEDCVEVEVVSAPGLPRGIRLHFTQAAVARMSVVAPEKSGVSEHAPGPRDVAVDSAAATRQRH